MVISRKNSKRYSKNASSLIKLDSTSKESALKLTAIFDRFKKEAEQAGESHFTQLFGALSQSLKDKFLDRKEDLGERNLQEFN